MADERTNPTDASPTLVNGEAKLTPLSEPTLVGESRGHLKIVTYQLDYRTTQAREFIDLTPEVHQLVERAGLRAGTITVQSMHTTAAVVINENEPLLLQDMGDFLERLAPSSAAYRHDDFTVRVVNVCEDECANGHAHCKHLMLGPIQNLLLVEGRPVLGRWQRIFLIELDQPRPRSVLVQISGV